MPRSRRNIRRNIQSDSDGSEEEEASTSAQREPADQENFTSPVQTNVIPKTTRRLERSSIINLSNFTLTKSQKALLHKGLNFIPTPKTDHPAKQLQDYLLFDRRLRLKYLFNNIDNTQTQHQNSTTNLSLINPSTGWTPQSGQDTGLDTYRTLSQLELLTQLKTKRFQKNNLKKVEIEAMKELAEEDSIVIKPADKGGCIVIQNKEDYIREGMRQLNNKDHYRKLATDPTIQFNNDINKIISEANRNNVIDARTKRNLTTKFPRTSNFYMLPKIHKKDNPGRPIINSIGSPTEKISAYIDNTLKPLARKVDSFIKDTTDYINMLKTVTLDPEDILVTIDVSALYTNIPHDEGIQAIHDWMHTNNIATDKIDLICELATKILKCNCFKFNGSLFIQEQGTAMGTRMAPNYAIIFMHQLETKLLAEETLKPKIWKRFIDDIFCVWSHGKHTLQTFLTNINTKHNTIKFTWEISNKEIPFLDTITYVEGDKLYTKIYHKPTDNKQYLHYQSCHPKRQKESVPNGLYLRARRICNKESDFEDEAHDITVKLRRRCYPEELLTQTLVKIKQLDREDLLKPRTAKKDDHIRYITNYNPNNPYPRNTIMKFSDILHTTRKPVIEPKDLQITYSRSRNIRDHIIKGQLTIEKVPRGCRPCLKPRCKTCDRITTKLAVTNNNNESFPITSSFNCQSYNLVYLMTCNICNINYVGETSNTLNQRCRGHESTIRTNKEHPVADHYNTNNHTPESYSITAIDREPDKNRRLRLEDAWMILMQTLHPYGLNARM
jgi:hypothetical protein